MFTRARVQWTLAIAIAMAALLMPALWNRFPLLQYDTGGYLARWYEGYLVPSRAVVYGLILNAGEWWNFWPVIALQSALTLWVIALVLRAHGLFRPAILAGTIVSLCVLTTLPWLSSILLTDIFCGLAVLALYLLLLRPETLRPRDRAGLIALIAVAGATHSATLAVLLALMLCAALFSLIDRASLPPPRLRYALIAAVLSVVLVFAANLAVARQLSWTPGGFALSFGRMLQDGIVKRYLDDHCPDSKLQLCAYKDQLPDDADVWFWGNALFDRLGRFAGLGHEMETIALNSIAAYPGLQFKAAAVAAARQLIDVHTGEGVVATIGHTYGVIERYVPWAVPAMRAARQQHGEVQFTTTNTLHYPLALFAMALLPLVIVFGDRRARQLAATITLAILANAVICGVFSNPHDRYGARVVWLATFAVLIAGLQHFNARRVVAT